MCKHHLSVGIANAVQTRHHRAVLLGQHAHVVVRLHEAAISLDTSLEK